MIANTLCQFLTQTSFREPLEGRAKQFADSADRFVYDGLINLPEKEKAQRARLVIYTISAYLALC
jgi:hypothetical protein